MATRPNNTQFFTKGYASKYLVKNFEESFSPNQPSVRITYDVSWAERWKFCKSLLGWSELKEDPVTGKRYISRSLPYGYRGSLVNVVLNSEGETAFLPWLYATKIENMIGTGPSGVGPSGEPLYDRAEITISFEPLHHRIREDSAMIKLGHVIQTEDPFFPIPDESFLSRYVTRFLRPVVESREIPLGRWKWAEGAMQGNWSGSPLRQTVSFLEVVYIWRQVPSAKPRDVAGPPSYAVPKAVPLALGAVNKTLFDGFGPGTLQLTSVIVSPYRWLENYYYADIIYTCKYFNAKQPSSGLEYNPPKGHNYFLHTPTKDDGSFEAFEYRLATHDGNETGIRVNREFEFRDLFRPDPVS